ncbi:MAG: hypothetical protein CVU31_02685 [Betaproteobacteria bacterium HGW-Betaproteobacteria-4]|jgi:hypothetical protein|nr:MAG: hypothetical protein CVU31_02685 [Betaproteobacteria bacterium HGW-Betaproteobacteria-4]
MSQAIYPATLAAMTAKRAGEKYRPSNGTEGDLFFAAWCGKCQRDKAMREGCAIEECDDSERCDLIASTMMFDIDEPGYPTEWQYDKTGQPSCTAYIPAGDLLPPQRCEHTQDLFA